MRKLVLPFEQLAVEAETQPKNLQIVPIGPKGTLARIDIGVVERAKTRTKAAAPKGTLAIEAQVDAVPTSKAALISTLVQTQVQASQDILATTTIANALLLLTTRPKFDRTTFEAISELAKSSTTHTEKVPSEEPISGPSHAFPSANDIQSTNHHGNSTTTDD